MLQRELDLVLRKMKAIDTAVVGSIVADRNE